MDSLATALTRATAQVWLGADRLEQRTLPLPTPASGEVLVRITLATVCGSDRHTVHGRRSSPTPGILGHEAVGEVVGLGCGADLGGGASTLDGSPLALGDRVVWSVAVSCGACDRCRSGRLAKCRTVRKIGHEPLAEPWQLSGGYASHILLPAGAQIARVPDSVPDALAAPAACATATVMAAGEAAGSFADRTVLIIGAGMLGLSAVALAATGGATRISVVDHDPSRRDLAVKFGADPSTGSGNVETGSGNVETGSGNEPDVDVILDFSGDPGVIETAFSRLAIGGRLVLVGSVTPSDPVRLDPEQIVRRWLTVTGVHNYEPRHLSEALVLLADTVEHFPWGDLVSPPRPLAELAEVFGSGSDYPREAVQA